MEYRVSRCFLRQNRCFPITISRSLREFTSVALNAFCYTSQREHFKTAHLLRNLHLYSIVESKRFATGTHRTKQNNKISHVRQKAMSEHTVSKRKTTRSKQNVSLSQEHEQQRQRQHKKRYLPQSGRSSGKASVKKSKGQNNSLAAITCDTHKKIKRASPSTNANIARLAKSHKASTRKVSVGKRRGRKNKNVFRKHKRKNAYQRQRVKYNKRVAAIANLWKEHKEAESMKIAPYLPLSTLEATKKVVSQDNDSYVRSSNKKKEEMFS